ncbi:HNH endonuclease signature motif containing protein [Cronobacter sakazakii]|uniref:HNH endonuclease n=1 Tax=Cronobacter TaxID=413496 RepID=UPI000CFD51C3|nr:MULTISPECIES: HNH endonuclease signature motif containing protein [Cronobacter]ELY3758399.1 HNH endonuclease [Cronobacter universalis]EJH4501849.1 HNH endonuclease [Cronobacter sakazakii]ELQ6119461.1 HNH endonuclease [Cronobacter sakazakii]ELQ6154776.1 HNH endonuclease [Cronobacter sakazakii]ELQ6161515.1 HNH endonuclease [Cronobacter sakazakii]
MPPRIPKACRKRGCGKSTTDRSGYCEVHKGAGWDRHNKGQSAAQRGYGAEWRKVRNTVIKRDKGLCQTCKREGVIRPGSSVDHIIAKAHGGTDDPSNLECICSEHHKAKTARERLSVMR